jgi:response regulator RpfG family c-di-GMP phosphodiesterase
VQDNRTDITLLGIIMPEMNDYVVCRRLWEQPETQGIPITCITALAQNKDGAKGPSTTLANPSTRPLS